MAIGVETARNNAIASIMQPVRHTQEFVNVLKDIRVRNAWTYVQPINMVLSVWKSVAVRMVAVVIMFRANVLVHLVLQDHCKFQI